MKAKLTLTAATLLSFTSPAYAGFLGHEMQADWRFPDFKTVLETHTFGVSNDTELDFGEIRNSPDLRIDVGDDFILFERINCGNGCDWQDTQFNGFWFHDVNGTIPRITGVTFRTSHGVVGLEQSDLGFDADSVWANFAGVTTTGEYSIELTIEFIPAPATFALFALAGLATKRRRRKE